MTLEILTLVMVIIGIFIVGFTYVNIKKENAKNITKQMDINEAGFDEYHNELNETALDIYKELDDKYREILVIYDLIEKKHTEIKQSNNFVNKFNATVEDDVNIISSNSRGNNGYKNQGFEDARNEMDKMVVNQSQRKVESTQNNLSVFKKSNAGSNQQSEIDENLAMKLLDEQIKDEIANNKQSKHSDVIELLEKGFSVEQIARELNIGIGEVMLVEQLLKVKNEQK